MRRSSRSQWLSGIGAVVLIGGLVLANVGTGVTAAEAKDWTKDFPPETRFDTVFSGSAVLDKNTGLVWEQAPTGLTYPWSGARFQCVIKQTGGVMGWRLPSVMELLSVLDPFRLPAPFVSPAVFSGVQSARYWSTTQSQFEPTKAWFVDLTTSLPDAFVKYGEYNILCVRGPMNETAY